MKKQKTKQAGAGQKRHAEEPLHLPTLGLVAEEERFTPLRGLLQPVAATPVNELGEELRAWLKAEAAKSGQLPVALALIDACAARAGEIERSAPTWPQRTNHKVSDDAPFLVVSYPFQ